MPVRSLVLSPRALSPRVLFPSQKTSRVRCRLARGFVLLCYWLIIGIQPIAALEAKNNESHAHAVSWHLLQHNNEFATNQSNNPFFNDNVIRIEAGKSINVLLPGNQWFYLTRENTDPKHLKMFPLSAIVSGSPGMGSKQQWQDHQVLLAPQGRNRVVQIHNPNEEPIKLMLALGRRLQHQTFAPISWLHPDGNATTDQVDWIHFSSTNNQHQRFLQADNDLSFTLKKDKIYWQEAVQQVSNAWRTDQSQLWHWQSLSTKGAPVNGSGSNSSHANRENPSRQQILFAPSSRKQLLTSGNIEDQQSIREMRPGLFVVKHDENALLQIDESGFVRVQSSDQDWLFGKNYQRYSVPGLDQRLQRAQFSNMLHSLAINGSESKQALTISPPSLSGYRIIKDTTTLSVLNSWLSWSQLSPEAADGIQQNKVNTRSLRWDFQNEQAPDLSHDLVAPGQINATRTFTRLKAGQTVRYHNPPDNITNQLDLQAHFASEKGIVEVVIDGKPFKQFVHFYPEALSHFMLNPDFVMATDQTVPPLSTPQGARDTVARAALNLPAHWQTVEITAMSGDANVRVNYRKPRYPKLDGPQWREWLAQEFDENSLLNLLETNNVSADYQHHPHWIIFKDYLQIKQQQFVAQSAPEFWQQLLEKEQTLPQVFNLRMPDGMPGYAKLQGSLQNPNINDWSYWHSLLQGLRNAGWSGYANNLLNTLVRYHTHPDIVVRATEAYFTALQIQQNDALQVSLLSYVLLNKALPQISRNTLALSLATLFMQQDSCDRAFFVLGFASASQQRNDLISRCASREGFLSLARAYQSETPPEHDTQLFTNTVSVTPGSNIAHIKSQKNLTLFNPQRNVRQNNALATPISPVDLVIGGGDNSESSEIELEVRLWFDNAMQNTSQSIDQHHDRRHDWLHIIYGQETRYLPLYYSDYRSPALIHADGSVGIAHRFRIALPKQDSSPHVLKLIPQNHSVSINIKEVGTNVLKSFYPQPCFRDNTYKAKDWFSWRKFSRAFWRDEHQDHSNSREVSAFSCSLSKTTANEPNQFKIYSTDASQAGLTNSGDYFALMEKLREFEMAYGKSDKSSADSAALNSRLNAHINARLAQLNAELHSWPESPTRFKLLRRLNQHAQWQVQGSPIRVKKFSFYTANTNVPLTPMGYRARMMHVPYKPDWEKLNLNSTLNYNLAISQQQEYRLKLLSQSHLFQNDSLAQVEVSINGEVLTIETLDMAEEKSIGLPLKPGNQTLGIRLRQIADGQDIGQPSVLAQLQFKNQQGAWQEKPQTVRLRLFQADAKQPFQQFFPETVWLRIDSFTEEGLKQQQFTQAEKGIFSWYPDTEAFTEQTIGHRIYKLTSIPASEGEQQAIAANDTSIDSKLLKGNTINVSEYSQFPNFEYRATLPNNTDLPEFGETSDNDSWGISLSKQQRRSPTEDAAQNNRFWEVQGYRQDAWSGEPGNHERRYFSRYHLGARIYDSDLSDSLHFDYQWWDTQWLNSAGLQNVDLNLGIRIAAQDGVSFQESGSSQDSISSPENFADEGWVWSSTAYAEVQWQYSVNRRLFNRFSLRAWGNLIESGKDTQQFATSVYSQYKLDHRYGLRFTEQLRYKWHHDLESYASLTLNSNPVLDISSLTGDLIDNSILEIGSRVFYQGLSADISWRYQTFRADEDRLKNSKDSRISAALEWFSWHKDSHYRVRLGYDRNLTANENYWSIGFSYNHSGNRGTRDYQPQSLAFAPLREQQFINERLPTVKVSQGGAL